MDLNTSATQTSLYWNSAGPKLGLNPLMELSNIGHLTVSGTQVLLNQTMATAGIGTITITQDITGGDGAMHGPIVPTTTSGAGMGATFTFDLSGQTTYGGLTATIVCTTSGVGYVPTDTVTFAAAMVGGGGGSPDLQFTINANSFSSSGSLVVEAIGGSGSSSIQCIAATSGSADLTLVGQGAGDTYVAHNSPSGDFTSGVDTSADSSAGLYTINSGLGMAGTKFLSVQTGGEVSIKNKLKFTATGSNILFGGTSRYTSLESQDYSVLY